MLFSRSIRHAAFGFVSIASLVLGAVGCSEVLVNAKDAHANGMALYAQGQYDQAAGAFHNAIRQDPRDYHSYYYLGSSYDALNFHEQAIHAYKAGLDIMPLTLEGKSDLPFRNKMMDGLASSIAHTPNRSAEMDDMEAKARGSQSAEQYFIIAKTYRYGGDADKAVENYGTAALLGPKSFIIAKEYGLYLQQIGQTSRAETPLRTAYRMDSKDQQVIDSLRQIGITPGPSLKNENELAQPVIPRGPLPEVDLSKLRPGGGNPPAPSEPAIAPAPAGSETAQAPRD